MAINDHELDRILSRRAAPPPPAPGWEWRIADAAFSAAPSGARGAVAVRIVAAARCAWQGAGRGMGALFVLPRPAYALAACLVIGFSVGLAAEPVLDMMQQDQGMFIYMEDDAI